MKQRRPSMILKRVTTEKEVYAVLPHLNLNGQQQGNIFFFLRAYFLPSGRNDPTFRLRLCSDAWTPVTISDRTDKTDLHQRFGRTIYLPHTSRLSGRKTNSTATEWSNIYELKARVVSKRQSQQRNVAVFELLFRAPFPGPKKSTETSTFLP